MDTQDRAGSSMNDSGTGRKIGTPVTQPRSGSVLSAREIACLAYLTDKMEAPGSSIGKAIAPWKGRTDRGYAMIGNGVARAMLFYEPRLTSWVSDLRAWRITADGRAALLEARNKAQGE